MFEERGTYLWQDSSYETLATKPGLHIYKENSPIFKVDFHELSVSAEKSLDVLFADMVAEPPDVHARHYFYSLRGSRLFSCTAVSNVCLPLAERWTLTRPINVKEMAADLRFYLSK